MEHRVGLSSFRSPSNSNRFFITHLSSLFFIALYSRQERFFDRWADRCRQSHPHHRSGVGHGGRGFHSWALDTREWGLFGVRRCEQGHLGPSKTGNSSLDLSPCDHGQGDSPLTEHIGRGDQGPHPQREHDPELANPGSSSPAHWTLGSSSMNPERAMGSHRTSPPSRLPPRQVALHPRPGSPVVHLDRPVVQERPASRRSPLMTESSGSPPASRTGSSGTLERAGFMGQSSRGSEPMHLQHQHRIGHHPASPSARSDRIAPEFRGIGPGPSPSLVRQRLLQLFDRVHSFIDPEARASSPSSSERTSTASSLLSSFHGESEGVVSADPNGCAWSGR